MVKRGWLAGILLLIGLAGLTGGPVQGQDGGVIDAFEGAFDWWPYDDASVFTCGLDSPGYHSGGALRLDFEIGAEHWPGCGIDITDASAWAEADGLSFVWRGDPLAMLVSVTVYMTDPAQTNPDLGGRTPFEAYLLVPDSAWTPVALPWDRFHKSEWAGPGGAGTLDPAQAVTLIFVIGDDQAGTIWIDDLRLGTDITPPDAGPLPVVAPYDKFALWANGTQLRGANIGQRVVVPWVDGDLFLGSGHVGPPYTQADFDELAALGANYVNISGPGLFTEQPPYTPDEGVQANLDRLLEMAARADLFAVISARTGPGRSDFTFYDDDIEEWGDRSLVIEHIWTDQAAQDAWVAMWRYTAERYRDNPVVVGYDLMVEPNGAGRMLEIWEPSDFYPAYAGTLYDWNQLYPRIVAAIREVDPDTPILIGAAGWSGVRWLPALVPVDDPRVVYMVHQYEPQSDYTHQPPPALNPYPGRFDLDWDGEPDTFDRAWLDGFLAPIDDFKARYGVPVAVNEYGVERWVPNAADFLRDEMDLFEQRGLNHALWGYGPAWPPYQKIDGFDFRHGPDPDSHVMVEGNALLEVVRANWQRNTVRPSTVGK